MTQIAPGQLLLPSRRPCLPLSHINHSLDSWWDFIAGCAAEPFQNQSVRLECGLRHVYCIPPAAWSGHSAAPRYVVMERRIMASATMSKIIVGGVLKSGRCGIGPLRTYRCYRGDQIGLVARDSSGKTVKTNGPARTMRAKARAIGAAAGAAGAAAIGVGVFAPESSPSLARYSRSARWVRFC